MTFYTFFDPNDKNTAYKIVTDSGLTTNLWYSPLNEALSIPFSKYRPLSNNTTLDDFYPKFICLGEFSQIPTRESHPELFL